MLVLERIRDKRRPGDGDGSGFSDALGRATATSREPPARGLRTSGDPSARASAVFRLNLSLSTLSSPARTRLRRAHVAHAPSLAARASRTSDQSSATARRCPAPMGRRGFRAPRSDTLSRRRAGRRPGSRSSPTSRSRSTSNDDDDDSPPRRLVVPHRRVVAVEDAANVALATLEGRKAKADVRLGVGGVRRRSGRRSRRRRRRRRPGRHPPRHPSRRPVTHRPRRPPRRFLPDVAIRRRRLGDRLFFFFFVVVVVEPRGEAGERRPATRARVLAHVGVELELLPREDLTRGVGRPRRSPRRRLRRARRQLRRRSRANRRVRWADLIATARAVVDDAGGDGIGVVASMWGSSSGVGGDMAGVQHENVHRPGFRIGWGLGCPGRACRTRSGHSPDSA